MDIGLLLSRLTVGLTMAAHGAQKLFGWFGGSGLDGTGQFFTVIGFPPGRRHPLIAGLAESGGGLFLALGLFTPLASATVMSVMLAAVFSVHIKKAQLGCPSPARICERTLQIERGASHSLNMLILVAEI